MSRALRRFSRAAPLLIPLITFLPAPAQGQVGITTDIITGVVADDAGNPLAGVIIEALSLETQITRTATTNAEGRYTILFPDGGGQYRMTAKMIGVTPAQATLSRYADEDRLEWNIQLSGRVFVLEEIVVTAPPRPVRVPDRPTPGSVERNLTPDFLANLPLEAEDLNLLAALVPGVVSIDATDSSAASFSVAGQRPDANLITLDGLRFESGQVPQEGLRNTRVVTSTYDVSRGRFSGGLIASTSRNGSNALQGSFNYSLRDDGLALETGEPSAFTSAFSQHHVSGGVGGPLVRNRLFVYGSGQARLRTDPQPSLTSATAIDLERLGVAPDSVDRFMAIVDELGAYQGMEFDGNRSNDVLSGLLRIDYLASDNHTLTLRGDLRATNQDPSRISAQALPETGGINETDGSGVMASLASRLGVSVINEARAYFSKSSRAGDAYVYAPSGRVQVASELEDGATGISTLLFGGNARMPTTSRTTTFEFTDELSWLPGDGRHRFKVGVLVSAEESRDVLSVNRLGTFAYNSLADLETGTAASFRRTLAPDERSTRAVEYGVYVGDVWRPSRALQLTYGVRLDGSSFTNPPEYNPALDERLTVRTDRLPSEIDVSPRVGFTWTLGGQTFMSPPDLVVRGGVGRFRSPIPVGLVAQTQASTGLSDSESELSCIGAAVPFPEWAEYVSESESIPTLCAGPGPLLGDRAPSATVFDPAFGAPKAWRASIGVQRNLTSILRLSIDASYARGVSQYGFRDLSLDTSTGFVLTSENDRPVFVDPELVVPSTGALRLTDSRIDPSFAQVLEIGSDLESDTKQLSISLGGITGNGVVLNTSYTWSHVRDQSSQSVRFGTGGLGASTTGGNPNDREWSRSSFERRHSFLATVSYPFGTSLEVTAIGRLNSGRPYTPMVASDINGDGSRNDRAYIPTATASPAIARLLETASVGARSCLQKQLGQIAARNSCIGPWEGSFDLQVNYRPNIFNRQVSISLTTLNLLRGIDELLHGADGARGWGMRARPDQTLLFVEGFDPVAEAFAYSVNERFGATDPQANAFRTPFQIGIQLRAWFGPNRGRAALDRLRGGGGRAGFAGLSARGGRPGGPGAGRGGITGEGFLERFRALQVNPAQVALYFEDSLELNDEQVGRLTVLRDSLSAVNDSIGAELQAEIEQAGAEAGARGLIALIRPRMVEAQENARLSLEALRTILTPAQWELLPESLRNAAEARRPGAGRRRPGS